MSSGERVQKAYSYGTGSFVRLRIQLRLSSVCTQILTLLLLKKANFEHRKIKDNKKQNSILDDNYQNLKEKLRVIYLNFYLSELLALLPLFQNGHLLNISFFFQDTLPSNIKPQLNLPTTSQHSSGTNSQIPVYIGNEQIQTARGREDDTRSASRRSGGKGTLSLESDNIVFGSVALGQSQVSKVRKCHSI